MLKQLELELAIKIIQLSLNIGKNDLDRKMKQVQKFLLKKEQVRVVLTLRGREKSHPERGAELLTEVLDSYVEGYGRCVKKPSATNLTLTIMPL